MAWSLYTLLFPYFMSCHCSVGTSSSLLHCTSSRDVLEGKLALPLSTKRFVLRVGHTARKAWLLSSLSERFYLRGGFPPAIFEYSNQEALCDVAMVDNRATWQEHAQSFLSALCDCLDFIWWGPVHFLCFRVICWKQPLRDPNTRPPENHLIITLLGGQMCWSLRDNQSQDLIDTWRVFVGKP